MSLSTEELTKILVENNALKQEKIEQVLAKAEESLSAGETTSLWEALVAQEIFSDEELGTIVANHFNLPFVNLDEVDIPHEVLNLIPEKVARQHGVVAYGRSEEKVKVAISHPDVLPVLKLLEKKTGQKVVVAYATQSDLEKEFLAYTKDFQQLFEKMLLQSEKELISSVSYDPPIKKMVHLLIKSALEENVSDIHIEPKEEELIVRFRIDGILHRVLTLPKSLTDRIVTRVKILARLRTDEHLAAQDGKIKMQFNDERLDLRVSIIPIADGEKVVMRLLASRAQTYSLSNLGLNDQQLLNLKEAADKSYGMVISTGPTGSGKTTTIYSILKTLDLKKNNLTSIEDPVEYHIGSANQVQTNEKTGLTFAKGLRSLLRQDPDYIFVGEIRDNETAAIATHAALTGHLVFSTLHTNTAAGALPRLIDMGVEPFLAASTVRVIVGQRLVRKICPHCRVEEKESLKKLKKQLDIEDLDQYFDAASEEKEIAIYHGEGCTACHGTGYSGRIGVFEVLKVDSEIRQLIRDKADEDTLQKTACKQGMRTMLADGLDKVEQGITTIEELLRVLERGEL